MPRTLTTLACLVPALALPSSAFRVRLYGPLSCADSQQVDSFEGTEIHYGEWVPAESLGTGSDKEDFKHYFVPSGYEGKLALGPGLAEDEVPGCSAGGGSASLLGRWMLAAVLLRGRATRA